MELRTVHRQQQDDQKLLLMQLFKDSQNRLHLCDLPEIQVKDMIKELEGSVIT